MPSLYIEVEFPNSLSLEWVEIFKERESKMLDKPREYCWLRTVIVNLILYQIFRNLAVVPSWENIATYYIYS